MISVQEIHELENRRKLIKKEIYKKLYEDVSRKIRGAVSVGHKQTIARVPTYIFGYPTYDHGKACSYVKRQLEHSGFEVYKFDMGELYISWNKKREGGASLPAPVGGTEEEDDFPTFINLKKIANKLRNNNPSK